MDKPTKKDATLLVGDDALDLYVNELKRNFATILQEAGKLRTAIAEIEAEMQDQQPEPGHPAAQPAVPKSATETD